MAELSVFAGSTNVAAPSHARGVWVLCMWAWGVLLSCPSAGCEEMLLSIPLGRGAPASPSACSGGRYIPSSSRPLVRPSGSDQPPPEQGHLTSESPLQYAKLLFLLVQNPIFVLYCEIPFTPADLSSGQRCGMGRRRDGAQALLPPAPSCLQRGAQQGFRRGMSRRQPGEEDTAPLHAFAYLLLSAL